MIRVLHMIGSLNIGGAQTMVMNLYRNINREEIQFDFVVDHPEEKYFAKDIEKFGGKIFYLPRFKGYNSFQVKRAWEQFFYDHSEYKILHSHVRGYSSLFIPIARRYGVKTIIHSHSTSNGKGLSAIMKAIFQYPLRYQADYFMACSRVAGEWLFGKKICQSDRFQVVKNAIDAKKMIFDENIRNEVRNELGLKDDFTLGYLARVSEPKNPLFVIEVFAELKKIKSNSKLLFVGDGELLPKVKTYANELGVEDSIIYTGARQDIERMLFAMDFYILPSFWEGLGISLIEAQASGIKCICSENIPKEAIVTDLVRQINLSDGAEKWAKELSPMYERKSEFEAIKNAGYDIENSSKLMTKYYQNLAYED